VTPTKWWQSSILQLLTSLAHAVQKMFLVSLTGPATDKASKLVLHNLPTVKQLLCFCIQISQKEIFKSSDFLTKKHFILIAIKITD